MVGHLTECSRNFPRSRSESGRRWRRVADRCRPTFFRAVGVVPVTSRNAHQSVATTTGTRWPTHPFVHGALGPRMYPRPRRAGSGCVGHPTRASAPRPPTSYRSRVRRRPRSEACGYGVRYGTIRYENATTERECASRLRSRRKRHSKAAPYVHNARPDRDATFPGRLVP